MTSTDTGPGGVSRSIGQVLAALKGDFPDISISKIRFLESEGLIAPQRAPSGYRRYGEHDVERLRYVLSVQREHYLPLKVIRTYLADLDAGKDPAVPGAGAGESVQSIIPAARRLGRDDVIAEAGATATQADKVAARIARRSKTP